MRTCIPFIKSRMRFDRNELSGAFGDIGTDLPLIIGMILACGIDGMNVLFLFGTMQIITALIYGIPMPVQPLKMVAVLVITQKMSGDMLSGGGLAIGIAMLLLTSTGIIDRLARIIPLVVVRGIQMGLGLQLGMLALKEYIPADSVTGYVLAVAAFIIILALIGNRRFPPALPVIIIGVIYGFITKWSSALFAGAPGLHLPVFHMPSIENVLTGFVVLALPQIPLSLGNSIYASHQIIKDYFPKESVPVHKIGYTYSMMNIISPIFGGIPVCHGSGGLAGHYTFGARTGGSIVIYGVLYIVMGFLCGGNAGNLAAIFPKPILGVILVFEGLSLLNLVKDIVPGKNDFVIMLLVAMIAICLPFGYLIGMTVGTAMYHLYHEKAMGIPEPVHMQKLINE